MLKIPIDCTGCFACVCICPKHCVSMKDSVDGFFTPQIDLSQCIDCGQCEKVCPIINQPEVSSNTIAYAIKNNNYEERYRSSSGGLFPLVARFVLSLGGIVVGAAYDEKFVVRHILIENEEQLYLLQGAKYSQSILGESFSKTKKMLEFGRWVLFSGTPCQCMGLKKYLGQDYKNLIITDLICHGVPSPKIWQTYIDFRSNIENNGIRPIEINMRSKVSGWSRYNYSTEFNYGKGHITRIHNSQDLYMKAFGGNICLRDSCSHCIAKGVERCTDFTLGDYWGVWNQFPDIDDNNGVSIVFVHTKKGKEILDKLKKEMECKRVDLYSSYEENASLVVSSTAHEKKQFFLTQVTKSNFQELIYMCFPISEKKKKEGIIRMIKNRINKYISRSTNTE